MCNDREGDMSATKAMEAVREWRSNVEDTKRQAMRDNNAHLYNSACQHLKIYDTLEAALLQKSERPKATYVQMTDNGLIRKWSDTPFSTGVRYVQADECREEWTSMLAVWMIENGFATGHGDTMSGLLAELSDQVKRLRAAAMEADSMRYR
jgi:L-rhamnose mutarotase